MHMVKMDKYHSTPASEGIESLNDAYLAVKTGWVSFLMESGDAGSWVLVHGDMARRRYTEHRTGTPAFAIVNASVSRTFKRQGADLTLRLGVENLLDKYYTTFSDWNKIPQKGRNIYANIDVSL